MQLGLAMVSSFLCIYLIQPVFAQAIDGLQVLTDRAMVRAGLPPYNIRA